VISRGHLDGKEKGDQESQEEKQSHCWLRLVVKIPLHYQFPVSYPLPPQYQSHSEAIDLLGPGQTATVADAHDPGALGIGLLGAEQLRFEIQKCATSRSTLMDGWLCRSRPSRPWGVRCGFPEKGEGSQRFLLEYAKQQLKAERR